ncbi:hypothetical protein JB92DRAFT_2143470 [Gautieria morchelliformis]|nr:hypothetical protein JB92DRAFT_2143470 [Gautieria morchelliformis]
MDASSRRVRYIRWSSDCVRIETSEQSRTLMEYKPRHIQPFSVEQAALLEIPVITTEIARLQNSQESGGVIFAPLADSFYVN